VKESNLTVRTLAKRIQKMNKICSKLVVWVVVVEFGTKCGEIMSSTVRVLVKYVHGYKVCVDLGG